MHASKMKAERQFDRLKTVGEIGFDDFGQRDKSAEKIAGGEQVRQEINL